MKKKGERKIEEVWKNGRRDEGYVCDSLAQVLDDSLYLVLSSFHRRPFLIHSQPRP